MRIDDDGKEYKIEILYPVFQSENLENTVIIPDIKLHSNPSAFILGGADGFCASGGHTGSLETEKQVASPFHSSEHSRVRRRRELGQEEVIHLKEPVLLGPAGEGWGANHCGSPLEPGVGEDCGGGAEGLAESDPDPKTPGGAVPGTHLGGALVSFQSFQEWHLGR